MDFWKIPTAAPGGKSLKAAERLAAPLNIAKRLGQMCVDRTRTRRRIAGKPVHRATKNQSHIGRAAATQVTKGRENPESGTARDETGEVRQRPSATIHHPAGSTVRCVIAHFFLQMRSKSFPPQTPPRFSRHCQRFGVTSNPRQAVG
jgi:hypothetical protein